MAIRNLRYDGDEILRKKCRVVTEINESVLTLLDDMAETMYKFNGVGLAAPQVGILKRILVIDVGEGIIEMINPEIISTEGEHIVMEGCLSIPGVSGEMKRPKKVVAKALNRKGEEFTITGEDLLAQAICHEVEHLDGILFTDHAIRIIKNEE